MPFNRALALVTRATLHDGLGGPAPEAGPNSDSSGMITRQPGRKERLHYITAIVRLQLSGLHDSSSLALGRRLTGASEAALSLLHAHGAPQHICNKPWFHCTKRQAATAGGGQHCRRRSALAAAACPPAHPSQWLRGFNLSSAVPMGVLQQGIRPVAGTSVPDCPTGTCTQRTLMGQPRPHGRAAHRLAGRGHAHTARVHTVHRRPRVCSQQSVQHAQHQPLAAPLAMMPGHRPRCRPAADDTHGHAGGHAAIAASSAP